MSDNPLHPLNNFKLSLSLITIAISIHVVLSFLLIVLRIPFYEQLAFELLNFMFFPIILIISKIDSGINLTIFLLIMTIFVGTIEIINITTTHGYTLTGFRFILLETTETKTLVEGGYPIAIPLGWALFLYGSFSLTNLLFNNFGSSSINSLSEVSFRVISDGLIALTYATFIEAAGENLGWWSYTIGSPDQFFGIPIGTLYYYILFSFFFSTVVRFSIFFHKKNKNSETKTKENNLNFFHKYQYSSSIIASLFLYSWIFMFLLTIVRYGVFYWTIVVSIPPLALYLSLLALEFKKNFNKKQNLNGKENGFLVKILQKSGIIILIFLIFLLLKVLEIFTNLIYMSVVFFIGLVFLVFILKNKKNL